MRASYPRAIAWLGQHLGDEWLDDERDEPVPPAAHLVCHLWDKPADVVMADVRAWREREGWA